MKPEMCQCIFNNYCMLLFEKNVIEMHVKGGQCPWRLKLLPQLFKTLLVQLPWIPSSSLLQGHFFCGKIASLNVGSFRLNTWHSDGLGSPIAMGHPNPIQHWTWLVILPTSKIYDSPPTQTHSHKSFPGYIELVYHVKPPCVMGDQ